LQDLLIFYKESRYSMISTLRLRNRAAASFHHAQEINEVEKTVVRRRPGWRRSTTSSAFTPKPCKIDKLQFLTDFRCARLSPFSR
jgi:hypothetical protein